VNVLGTYQGPDHKATANIDFHQKELAAYLARARGPGDSSMKFNLRPRPTGEAARVVFKEYDFPLEGGHVASNDGSDWSLGTPSGMNHVNGVHDAYADLSGNLWFTYAHPGFDTTVGKIDAKSGATKSLKLDDQKGYAVGAHGITRDENGNLWFNTRSNVARGHGGLGKIDPKTDKLTVYIPPRTTTGTAGTLDADMKGNIWVTEPGGALRFDIAKETFTEFKSVTYKNQRGTATVYGLAADRTGNGWWLLMQQDKIDFSDIKTGKTGEIELPVDKNAMASLTPEQTKFYETYVPPDFNNPIAWGQSPRRMGADHNGDFVYVGNSFGGNLAKINIHTKETTIIPLPNPDSMQPYQVSIDQNHNVWTNLWSTDAVARLDPSTNKWTLFDLPNRGTETRHISLLERDGQPMQVIIPYSRTRKVAVMTVRTEAEIAALKTEASR
jgi:streptogramin lyase